MSRLIVVCGLPGSGKTTLARELSRRLNIVCLHKDSIKENLYEIMKMSSLEESKSVGVVTIKLLYALARDVISTGADLMIEGPFSFEEDKDIFAKIKDEYRVDLVFVVCAIEEGERKRRFMDRERHMAHHDAERLVVDSDNPHWSYLSKIDYDQMPGKIMKVDTNKPVGELVDVLLSSCNLDNVSLI